MSSYQAWTRTDPLDPALSRGLRLRALESHEESRALARELAERDGLELDLCRARESDLVPGLDDADLLACFRGAREVLVALVADTPRPRARLRVLREAEQVVLEIRSQPAGTASLPQADALSDLRARLAEMGVELVVAERAGEDRHLRVAVPLRHRHDREGWHS